MADANAKRSRSEILV